MNNGLDSTDIGHQPKKDNRIEMCIYFLCFMVIGSLFILNLFVGVIIDNFNKIRESEEIGTKGLFITENQKRWIEIQHIMLRKDLKFKQPLPQNNFRLFFYMIVTNDLFDYFILLNYELELTVN